MTNELKKRLETIEVSVLRYIEAGEGWLQEVNELKEAIEREAAEPDEWPKCWDQYWFIERTGEIDSVGYLVYQNDELDKKYFAIGHDSVTIDTGVHVELPAGYYGKIESKSGLNVHHGIASLGGAIDESYRGSIKVKLYNLTDVPYLFAAGDKIAQLVIQPYLAPTLVLAESLSETDRGEGGFGSSGR